MSLSAPLPRRTPSCCPGNPRYNDGTPSALRRQSRTSLPHSSKMCNTSNQREAKPPASDRKPRPTRRNRHDSRHRARQLAVPAGAAHPAPQGPDVRRHDLDLCSNPGPDRPPGQRIACQRDLSGRPGRLSRFESARLPRDHVRRGPSRRYLRPVELPPHRSGTQLHHHQRRHPHADRRRTAPPRDRSDP